MKYYDKINLEEQYENTDKNKFVALYAITMDNVKTRKNVRIKIGMSTFLTQRLYSYSLPMPDGFYILGILRIKIQYKKKLRELEKRLQELSEDFHYHSEARLNSREWLITTPSKLSDKFMELYNENPHYYKEEPTYPIQTNEGERIAMIPFV